MVALPLSRHKIRTLTFKPRLMKLNGLPHEFRSRGCEKTVKDIVTAYSSSNVGT